MIQQRELKNSRKSGCRRAYFKVLSAFQRISEPEFVRTVPVEREKVQSNLSFLWQMWGHQPPLGNVYDSIASNGAHRIQYREATEGICSFNSFQQEKLSNFRRKGLSRSSVSYSTSSIICSVTLQLVSISRRGFCQWKPLNT